MEVEKKVGVFFAEVLSMEMKNDIHSYNIKLKAYRNSSNTLFLSYAFFVVLNDMLLNRELDYKYIFTITFILMIFVFYITILISKFRKNEKIIRTR